VDLIVPTAESMVDWGIRPECMDWAGESRPDAAAVEPRRAIR